MIKRGKRLRLVDRTEETAFGGGAQRRSAEEVYRRQRIVRTVNIILDVLIGAAAIILGLVISAVLFSREAGAEEEIRREVCRQAPKAYEVTIEKREPVFLPCRIEELPEPVLLCAEGMEEEADAQCTSIQGEGRSNGDSLSPTEDAKTEERYLSEDDVYCIAAAIYQEAGADFCSDETRRMVADVVLNRVEDERYPDTIREVLEQYAQYGFFWRDGVGFPARANTEEEKAAVQRAYDLAYGIAAGEHSELYGAGYIFQAEFQQGWDCVWQDGMCFGKG